jgi:hypothetical protein
MLSFAATKNNNPFNNPSKIPLTRDFAGAIKRGQKGKN